MKPIAQGINQWDGETEIIYCCPMCCRVFPLLGGRAEYCFECGQKIDWHGIMVHAPVDKAETYHSDWGERAADVVIWINEQNGVALEDES